ncbi:MAG: PDZ domain-containing protein [Candidatus Thiodiazotropha sp. L084R]
MALRLSDLRFRFTIVLQNSPASMAGLRPGDVITSINDAELSNFQDQMQHIAGQPPGTQLVVGGWRGNDAFSLNAVSDERSEFDK